MSDSPTPKLRVVSGYFPTTLPIDGFAIKVRITRLTLEQYGAFMRAFQQVMNPHSARLVSMRYPGEEQERHPFEEPDRDFVDAVALYKDDRLNALLASYGAALARLTPFVIPDAEIRRRRLVEMTDAQRAEYERLAEQEEAVARTVVAESVAAYVRIVPGQIERIDPETDEVLGDVTTGADLVALYGARLDVLDAAMRAIAHENTVPAHQKNASGSGLASPPSLAAPNAAEVPGGRPEPTATSVDAARSVTSAAVMASTDDTKTEAPESSGTTTPALV